MIDQKKFYECLEDSGVEFITGVPDSLLNEFCLYIEANLSHEDHVIAANEGNAIALATGHYLATGSVPLVYMQNSGIGNALNPLISLTNQDVYAIPMVLLIGWRGAPDVDDWAHHKKQGQLTPVLLDALDIPFRIIEDHEEEALNSVRWAVSTASNISGPVALLAKKGVLEKGKKEEVNASESGYEMSRENAIECVLRCVPKDTVFVATTGRATREIYELRDLTRTGHELDFLNVGAMGHASSIATGLALGQKERLIVCLDGDAAAVMHLGALTTAGVLRQSNFLHVVLNNGAHESVGGQVSVGHKINFTAIAENAGYNTIGRPVETEQELKDAIKRLLATGGSAFMDIRIRKGIRSDLPPLKVSLADLKKNLMNEIR